MSEVFYDRQLHPAKSKTKAIQLGVQNQIKFVELVANATRDPFPTEEADIGRTWETSE